MNPLLRTVRDRRAKKTPPCGGVFCVNLAESGLAFGRHIGSLWAFGAFFHVKAYGLTFRQ